MATLGVTTLTGPGPQQLCLRTQAWLTQVFTGYPVVLDHMMVHSYEVRGGAGPAISLRGVVYAETGSDPGALVVATGDYTELAEGWNRLDFPGGPVGLPPGDYYIGVQSDSPDQVYLWSGATSTGGIGFMADAPFADGAPDPWPADLDASQVRRLPVYLVVDLSVGAATLAPLVSDAAGTVAPPVDPVTGTASGTLGALAGEAAGVSGRIVRHEVCLRGSWRPAVTLNATWVARI